MRLTVIAALFLIAGCSADEEGDPLGEFTGTSSEEGTAIAARAGPFGFDMGQKIDRVDGAEELRPNLYEVTSPPKPHPDFESVVLGAFDGTGICTIRGLGRDLENDGGGLSIRAKVDSLAEALEVKYGKPTKIDACSGDDITCDEKFWMMFLREGRRAYGYTWPSQNSAMKAAGIGDLVVLAQAGDISTSYPVLEFNSAEAEECRAAENAASAAAL